MRYQLLASDLDGTLLDPSSRITENTEKAVKAMERAGARFVISTGRPPQGVRDYIRQLGLTGPVICYNGAMIVRADTGEVLYEQGLSRADAETILELGHRWDVTMCIWAGNELYGSRLDERFLRYHRSILTPPQLAQSDEQVLDLGVTKILFYDTPERIAEIRDSIAMDSFHQVNYCTSQPFYLEFFSGLASKAAAMERVGVLTGIPREAMMAVGDGENDLSMLQAAGLGVAMDNAPETVKAAAGEVTASNREDGVARLIEKYFL